MKLQDLYQELIIDHGTEPRNCYCMANATHHAKGFNPLCGDQLEVFLHIEHDQITDVSFEGQGCAISMASASVMTETLKGKTLAEAYNYFKRFIQLLTSDLDIESSELGKLQALAGVRAFPSRVKCATLAWHAMDAALKNDPHISTE